jgi:hypothetical protein
VSTFATRLFAFTDQGLIDWQRSYEDFAERYATPVAAVEPAPVGTTTALWCRRLDEAVHLRN